MLFILFTTDFSAYSLEKLTKVAAKWEWSHAWFCSIAISQCVLLCVWNWLISTGKVSSQVFSSKLPLHHLIPMLVCCHVNTSVVFVPFMMHNMTHGYIPPTCLEQRVCNQWKWMEVKYLFSFYLTGFITGTSIEGQKLVENSLLTHISVQHYTERTGDVGSYSDNDYLDMSFHKQFMQHQQHYVG